MSKLLGFLGIVAFLAGVVMFGSPSVSAAMQGLLLWVIGAVLCSGAGIVEAIDRGRPKEVVLTRSGTPKPAG